MVVEAPPLSVFTAVQLLCKEGVIGHYCDGDEADYVSRFRVTCWGLCNGPSALKYSLLRHQIRLRVDAAEHDALVRLGHGGDKRDLIIAWIPSEQGIDAL